MTDNELKELVAGLAVSTYQNLTGLEDLSGLKKVQLLPMGGGCTFSSIYDCL